jgi:hypothetical protein
MNVIICDKCKNPKLNSECLKCRAKQNNKFPLPKVMVVPKYDFFDVDDESGRREQPALNGGTPFISRPKEK